MLAEYHKDDLYSALEGLVLRHPKGAPEELGWAARALEKLAQYAETSVEAQALIEDWEKKNKRFAAYFKATSKKK